MGTGRLPRLAAALQHRVLRLLVRAASGAHADPLRRNVALARRCRRAAAARLVGHAVYANVPVARGRASPAVAPRVAADHPALAGRAPRAVRDAGARRALRPRLPLPPPPRAAPAV